MNQRPKSRKRNVVSGNVFKIQKQEETLEEENVGERANLISRIISRRKENKEND